MRPGATALTRMPTVERSRATGNLIATIAPFDPEYDAWPIWPSNPAIDAMFTTTPPEVSPPGSFRAIAPPPSPARVSRARGARDPLRADARRWVRAWVRPQSSNLRAVIDCDGDPCEAPMTHVPTAPAGRRPVPSCRVIDVDSHFVEPEA